MEPPTVAFWKQWAHFSSVCLFAIGLLSFLSFLMFFFFLIPKRFLQYPLFFSSSFPSVPCNWRAQPFCLRNSNINPPPKKKKVFHVFPALTFLLTPRSRVLLEKLTGLQLVKKFSAFYGTRKFITALTSARHLSLSWASSIQSTHPHPTSRRSILILSSHLHHFTPCAFCVK